MSLPVAGNQVGAKPTLEQRVEVGVENKLLQHQQQQAMSGQPGRPGLEQRVELGVENKLLQHQQQQALQHGQPGFVGQPGMVGQPGFVGQPGMVGQPGFVGQPGLVGQSGLVGQPGFVGQPGMVGQSGLVGQQQHVGVVQRVEQTIENKLHHNQTGVVGVGGLPVAGGVATNVVVEKIVHEPVVVEHHHHHTHTVIHPEVERQHDTTEIRQVIQPIHERVQGENLEEYAGKHVKVIEREEDAAHVAERLRQTQLAVAAEANVTHTHGEDVTVAATKEKDIHGTHRVIEEVTPVIYRDVEHQTTVHKEELVVEKIHHAAEVIVQDERQGVAVGGLGVGLGAGGVAGGAIPGTAAAPVAVVEGEGKHHHGHHHHKKSPRKEHH